MTLFMTHLLTFQERSMKSTSNNLYYFTKKVNRLIANSGKNYKKQFGLAVVQI